MRLVAPVLFFIACLAAAVSGFSVRRVFYANDSSADVYDALPHYGGSIIQVKSSKNTDNNPKSTHINSNRFPRFSNYQQYVEATEPTVTHSSQLVNKRRTRELRSGQELANRLEAMILRESLAIEMQRHARTLIQAPLFKEKQCPPGQRLDRGRVKCRGAW